MTPALSSPAAGDAAPVRRTPWIKILAVIATIAVLMVAGRKLSGYVEPFSQWVEGLGLWGPVVFIAAYAIATVAFVPGSLLTLAAGALFGVVSGTLYVFIAAVLGSTAAFLIARYLARAAIERRLAGNTKFAAIDRAIGVEGRKIAFLLRLSPVFPFNLLNYGLGLTQIRLVDYLLASLGMLPGTILYVYLGSVGKAAASLAAGGAPTGGSGKTVLLVVGLAATLLVTVVITRAARRALHSATGA